jgi:hypothetical protein
MDENGQLHEPAALPSRKKLTVFIGLETWWTSKPVWIMWRK